MTKETRSSSTQAFPRPRNQRTNRFAVLAALALAVPMALIPTLGAGRSMNAARTTAKAFKPAELFPLYDGGNATNWSQTCSHANNTGNGSLIIADVAHGDGAGSARVDSWASVIHNCYRYDRASVIGYVATNYGRGGNPSIASIEAGIDNWYKFYPGDISGIFVDEVSDTVPETGASNQTLYQTIASYVHTKHRNSTVVLNFGYNPTSNWMLNSTSKKNADLVVTFEGSYNTWYSNPYTAWSQAAWETAYPASDFAAIIYDAPSSTTTPQPSTACAALARQHIGYVYIGTWYDQLPYLSNIC